MAPTSTTDTDPGPAGGKGATMADSPFDSVDQFLADRQAWIDAGRPADARFAHWRGVVEAEQARQSGADRPSWVEPLVSFG